MQNANRALPILIMLSLGSQKVAAQTPALHLTAKVRDMHECISDGNHNDASDCSAVNAQPDFESMNNACGDTGYVAPTISTAGDLGDTVLFPMDNRTPVKTGKLVGSSPGVAGVPCFTSVANFDSWYNDRIDPAHPGSAQDINRPFLTDLTFTYNAAQNGYEFNSPAFFPLDSANNPVQFRSIPGDNPNTFGNLQTPPRNNHDYGFTMEFHAYFTFTEGANQSFTFGGDDDVWVFINGKLAMDMGGVHGDSTASIYLDPQMAALGLVNHQVYILDFFFAERHSVASVCLISTSLQLHPHPMVATPTATPPGQGFVNPFSVALSDWTSGAAIYYTTDGSAPDSTSALYTGPIPISATTTLQAVAYKNGYTHSEVAAWTYTKYAVMTAPPTITPAGKSFTTLDSAFTVAIIPGDTGVVIHYTTDGSMPDSNSAVYTGPITVSSSETIQAVDIKGNQLPSAIATAIFTQTLAPKVNQPIATPPGAANTSPENFQTSPLSVALSDSTSGAAIFDSWNGAVFTAGTAVSLTQSGTLKAYATKAGMYPSDTLAIQFNYTPPPHVVKAWYLDANGDGSIDAAMVAFNQALPMLPAKMDFKLGEADNRVEDRAVSGADIAFAGNGDSTVLITFATPFARGVTALGAGTIGQVFTQSNIPLRDGTFPLGDSVAPVIVSGAVYQPDSSNPWERVVLAFSEPSVAPVNSQSAFVFKRAGDLFPVGGIVVDGIQKTGTTEYTLLIDSASSQPPIVGDSTAIEADDEVKDVFGNAPTHRLFARLGGSTPQPTPVHVYVQFPNGSNRPGNTAVTEPAPPENVVFIPIGAEDQALPGSDNGKCGSCVMGKTDAPPTFVGPIINLEIPGPVNYEFQIFSNLGEFVVNGSGQVVSADLPLLEKIGGNMYKARFIWTGRSAQGAKAGTGAYILQCTVHTLRNPRTGTPPSTQVQRILFGLIRQAGS